MKLAERIFKRNDYYITSPFGYRTRNGKKELHNGTDFGTNRQKWKQYAVEDGEVISVAKSSVAGNTLEILYPRLDRISRHIHLDKVYVKKGQKVDNSTHIADTGATGSGVTGVHLHLAWIIPKAREYLDPEAYNYQPVELVIGGDRDLTKDQVLINANQLRIRKEPNTSSEVLGFVENKKYYEIFGNKEGWYLIEKGWISGQYCQLFNKKDDDVAKIQELEQRIAERDKEVERLITDNTSLKGILTELQQQLEQDKANIYKEIKIPKKALYLITLHKGKLVIYRD